MKNILKRMLSMVLSVVLVLGMVPAAYASTSFTDLQPGAYYVDPVAWAVEKGITDGTSATTFEPGNDCTRAQVVTFLWRAKGSPEPQMTASAFSDVQAGQYYTKAVLWATESGITDGMGDGIFGTNATVTRGQFVTFLWRAQGSPAVSGTNPFADVNAGQYYTDAVLWAVENIITDGTSATTFEPDIPCNRGQVVTFLYRAYSTQPEEPQPTDPPVTEPEPTEPVPTVPVLTSEKDQELQAQLQTRIGEILGAGTEIIHADEAIPGKTYTGTAYYVSNDGDDNNDGLTPETAWRTTGKILYEAGWGEEKVLRPGDAIFFRRGDIFRLNNPLMLQVEGITYSAYCEGDKPILTASSENGTGPEKWQLVYEDASGKKIWQYYRDMGDISMVVLNDGQVVTDRVYEYYKVNQYVSCVDAYWWMHDDKGVELLDRLLSPEEALTENHTIISRPERYDTEGGFGRYSGCDVGPLYLRCDEGNPGALYESVEFSEFNILGLIWLQADNNVFDNISFRCNGHSYIKNGMVDVANTLIQNCEFAYGGGSVTYYDSNGEGKYIVTAQGDGVYCLISNTLVQNCYFHDCLTTTTTYEAALDHPTTYYGYYQVLDNVMVNTMGIRLDSTSEALKYLDSVIIRGNYIWNTGRMDRGKYWYSEGSIVLMPNNYGECVIEENIFYTTEKGHKMNALLDLVMYDFEGFGATRPILRNNIYVQYADRNFADFIMQEDKDWAMDDPLLLAKAAQLLRDTTSEFYVIR